MISSPFYACVKQMFTSVFTNVYICIYKQINVGIHVPLQFMIVSFSSFLFITCAQKKTFSEEIVD